MTRKKTMPARLKRVAISITVPPELKRTIEERGYNRSQTICADLNAYYIFLDKNRSTEPLH